MYNKIELEIHDSSFDDEMDFAQSANNWSLEDSQQYKLIEQGEKENAVNEWSLIVIEQAKLKNFRDK